MRIHEGLEKIVEEGLVSFHMPGHKSGRLVPPSLKSIYQYDITEIPGADNLHEATGIIKASQEALRDYYGSIKSFFLVNGSTSGLYAAIMATAKPSETLIVSRESHRSIYSAMMLGGIKARYLYPEIDPSTGVSQAVTLEKVHEAFERYPEAKGLVMTSPTFLGIISPVKEIAAYLHDRDKVLIVDEAHGAHLKMMGQNHLSSIFAEADLVIHSLHKTLPVLTQGSALHLNSDRIDCQRLEELLNIHQTSSPSYILMDSMDRGLRLMEEEGEILGVALLEQITRFEAGLKGHPHLKLMTHPQRDLTRLILINGDKARIDFNRLEMVLREKYRIQAEYSYDKGLVLIATIANNQEDFDTLIKALWELDFSQLINTAEYGTMKYIRPEKNLSLREAFYRDRQWIPLSEARGHSSASMIIPYPPGIPLIVPGEIFSTDLIERIHEMIGLKYNILGMKVEDHQHLVAVVKEEN